MTSISIFTTVIPKIKTHPQFRALRDSKFHGEVRSFMNELFLRMGDPNGNFVRDFQGPGFHSRIFELACFAYLENADFSLDRSKEKPDFFACRNGFSLAIEAATANPPTGRETDISIRQMPNLPFEQITEKATNEFPKRISSILNKKLNKKYHHLSHCKGKPIVIMVAPFFEPGSVFYTDENLVECLYGSEAFFSRERAASISAVLYCNSFTVPKFLRLALLNNKAFNLFAIRRGFYCKDISEQMFAWTQFEYQVGSRSAPIETWAEGVTIFENPNALIPLPENILPSSSTFSVRDGGLYRDLHGFHPVLSFTFFGSSKKWAK